jgi:hypothetical protein
MIQDEVAAPPAARHAMSRFPLSLPLVLACCLAWPAGAGAQGEANAVKLIANPGAFAALVNPNCSHCIDEAKRRSGELRADDPVLEWTRGYSDGGAIPMRFFLNPYRVIADSYGVFVYDPDAGYARGFAPSFHFVFHGWRNGVMVMQDQSDGSLYSCLSGVAFAGPRRGHRLASVPTLVTTWGDVMKRNPSGVAYHMFDKYQPRELPTAAHADSVATRAKVDPRLPDEEIVLGVQFGGKAKAYPVATLGAVTLDAVGGEKIVILKQGSSAAAYRPIAHQPRKFAAPRPDKHGVSPPNPGTPLPDGGQREPIAVGDFSRYDIAGRCFAGAHKGWTLEPVEAVQCKWFAWAAEVPDSEVQAAAKKPAAKMISGKSEFLRVLPKPFGVVKAIDTKAGTVSLLFDGEKVAKLWPVEPDAELRVGGWWGRLEQFHKDQRVWVWLKLNRDRQPVAVAMMADELSEWEMHASLAKKAEPKFTVDDVEKKRAQQRDWLRQRWTTEGLPGTLTFHHVFSGELELMLDHEAMRWGRSLNEGDAVTLAVHTPISAVVRSVAPWRERTRVRLVVGELQSADLKLGERMHLKMTPLSKESDDAPYPPDIGRKRTREERAEWFLCNVYCVCGVGKDTCTGMFYTLASCNPNGCGAPLATRDHILAQIDANKTDREIWDALLKDRGELLLRPHLRP